MELSRLFDQLTPDVTSSGVQSVYSVAHVPEQPTYFVGKASDERACILISGPARANERHAPIRLQNIEVQFDVRAIVRVGEHQSEDTFTIITCRSLEAELIHYFFSVCEALIRVLGQQPTGPAIAHAVNRLALIFRRLENPPSRPVIGLIGELFLIHESCSPSKALEAWRIEDTARFDFTVDDVRLDVKSAAGRARIHTFSYDQCNPPPNTAAIVASLFVERISGGVKLQSLISGIEAHVAENIELALKLHDVVAATLGTTLGEALSTEFDARLARASLSFYDLRQIPAIRDELPPAVSNVHFRSDLSAVAPLSVRELSEQDPHLAALLPPQ